MALLTIGALGACSSNSAGPSRSDLVNNAGGQYAGFGLVPPQPRPSFTLTDTSGKPYPFGTRTAKHPTLLFFGYTHCPDVCPTTLVDIAQALRQVPDATRAKVDVVFVTTDVKRDTGPVIQAWLTRFDTGLPNRFVGLTGSQVQVDAAQAAAHITLAQDDGQTHSAAVLLYGADDYARIKFVQSTNQADEIAHDLPLVAS